MTDALDIQQLSCAYPGISVLTNLSFNVRAGEFFIILGPNGSGKTTLLKALAGLLPLSGGKVSSFGRPLKKHSRQELARLLAYVAQSGDNDGSFTVLELVLMGRAPYLGLLGVEDTNDIEIAMQAIDNTDLLHLANRQLNSISGGERQRAHISRAICQHTKIILLDEPTAALDPGHQIRIMELMNSLKKDRKTTVIMVSHDLNLAAMYGDRLLLLAEGKMMACGAPTEVIQEEVLARAYTCNMLVDRSPAGDWPRVNLKKDQPPSLQKVS